MLTIYGKINSLYLKDKAWEDYERDLIMNMKKHNGNSWNWVVLKVISKEEQMYKRWLFEKD
jgi:hypothetical protein